MAEDAGAGQATGEGADEVEGVDLDAFAVDALAELPAGGTVEHELEGLAVDIGPFGDDVGDQAAVVIGGEVHRAVDRRWMSMRWAQTSRVNPTSSRYLSGAHPMGGPNGKRHVARRRRRAPPAL